ncbi:MAG: hypothetical protein ACI9N1_000492 [Flavobacteriales bacterium]|jgi:hypothetical protein
MVEQNGNKQKKIWYQLFLEPTSALIVTLLSFIISIPIFVSLYHVVPAIRIFGGIRIEHILLILVLFIVVFIIIKSFAKMFVVMFGIGIFSIGVSSLVGSYSFTSLYYDYSAIVYNLNEHLINYEFKEEKNTFRNSIEISAAINYRNEEVKKKANAWAVANFTSLKGSFPSLKLLHCFSIFKEARSRWNYVYDPIGEDYYASTSMTLEQLQDDDKLKGDCDDYSILIAGLMTSVGGEVRLVRTEVEDGDNIIGHLYPELKVGGIKDFEKIAYFLKNEMFIKETENKNFYYYIDSEGYVWLNMDYNDYYPGGKYQSLVRKSVLAIE